MLNTPLAQW